MSVPQVLKPKQRKYTARYMQRGHTVIDVLLARALVRAYLDLDYSPTIKLAQKLAALSERRAA